MYAIVDVAGVQVKAAPNTTVKVPRLDAEVGGEVKLDRVLLWSDGSAVEVGHPFVEGKSLTAEVLRHGREKKVIVFKKKRRKKYRRKNGHRQMFTELRVGDF